MRVLGEVGTGGGEERVAGGVGGGDVPVGAIGAGGAGEVAVGERRFRCPGGHGHVAAERGRARVAVVGEEAVVVGGVRLEFAERLGDELGYPARTCGAIGGGGAGDGVGGAPDAGLGAGGGCGGAGGGGA